MRRPTLLALLLCAVAVPAAGCGGDVEPIRGEDAPAITAPGTTFPYESGGADGSGGDGREVEDPRGGIGAGADTPSAGDRPGADDLGGSAAGDDAADQG